MKYDKFTKYLEESNAKSITLSFDTMSAIIKGDTVSKTGKNPPIPSCALESKDEWRNSEKESASSFVKGWINAGYRCKTVNIEERWVVFEKAEDIPTENPPAKPQSSKKQTAKKQTAKKQTEKETKKEEMPPKELTLEVILKLSVPAKLKNLERDQYHMVVLNSHNSDIVEQCILEEGDKAEAVETVMKEYFDRGDYSADAYFQIIHNIAITNSTRTPDTAKHALADYCANTENRFLDRLEAGEIDLVSDMNAYTYAHTEKNVKSLASKVCRYMNKWLYNKQDYVIYDAVVRSVLHYYRAFYHLIPEGKKPVDLEKVTYPEFYRMVVEVAEASGLDNHRLDHLLWYYYKDDSIHTAIAGVLAKKYPHTLNK